MDEVTRFLDVTTFRREQIGRERKSPGDTQRLYRRRIAAEAEDGGGRI
jgi:hypothetical protein